MVKLKILKQKEVIYKSKRNREVFSDNIKKTVYNTVHIIYYE